MRAGCWIYEYDIDIGVVMVVIEDKAEGGNQGGT